MTTDPQNVQYLFRGAKWYNPFFITVGGRQYRLKEIFLYQSDGSVFHIDRGWFGNGNNPTDYLPIPLVAVRNKPKYDGKAFIIKRGCEKIDDKGTKAYLCDLHLPAKYFLFEKEEDRQVEGFLTIHTPLYRCSWNSEVYFLDYAGAHTTENDFLKDQTVSLVAEKMKLQARLDEIDAKLRQFDPYGRVEITARKAVEKITGAAGRG